jgi:hypothetical protein
VVAGTASAVSGRVQRRQAEKFADRDAQIYADRQQAYAAQTAQAAPTYAPPPAAPAPPPPAAAGQADVISQLQQLGELHAQGILTDEEFAAQKAKVLAS